jgi:CubicO group peptidase (beta-lactamase class C family)
MPYDEFLRERLFSPLGMHDTGFWVPEEKRDRFSKIYTHDENRKLVPLGDQHKDYSRRPSLPSGGGGLAGTTPDYLRFCQMLLNNGEFNGARILGRKTVELMRQDHLPDGHGPILPFRFGYGLGVSVVRSLAEKQGICSVGEFNWGGAASTDMWIDPAEDMVTMIMMQLQPNFTQMLTKKVHDAMYQALV